MLSKALYRRALAAYVNVLCVVSCRTSCLKIARIVGSDTRRISHDALQRLLHIERDWNRALRQRYRHLLNGRVGRLVIDDTVLAKPFSRACPMLAWLWSSSDQRCLYGISCVLLIWTNGQTRVPLGVRFWSKNDDRSKLDLAIELLEEAKRRWKPRVDYVVFDSWYAAAKLLKATRALGWQWLTRIKCNRIVNGQMRVECYFRYRYGHARVRLNKRIAALVVKDNETFFATSNRRLSPHAVKALYRQRQWVEEVIRVLKSQLNIESCAARSHQAQTAHVYLALMAFCQLEQLRISHGIGTIYQLREQLLYAAVPRDLAWSLPIRHAA